MEHKHSDSMESNYEKLESRVRTSNLLTTSELLDQVLEVYDNLEGASLIVATGGSVVVAEYLRLILESLGNVCTVVEPRDVNYMHNLNHYQNMFLISNSGKTNGIENAVKKFLGKKYLITGNDVKLEGTRTLSYEELTPDKERSFISLATTMIPITLLVNAYHSFKESYSKEEMDEKIKSIFQKAKKYDSSIQETYRTANCLEILTGVDTKIAATCLESNLIETGAIPVVLHDKGEYCHGRSNLKFRNPKNPILYLSHEETELDTLLKTLLKQEYEEVIPLTSTETDLLDKNYEMLLKAYYLSKKIGMDKGIDVCRPDYNPNIVKKVYKYRGEM